MASFRTRLAAKTALAAILLATAFFSGCRTALPARSDTVSARRIGPVAEWAETAAGASMLAIRPFYSHEETGTNDLKRSVTDFLWPLGSATSFEDNGHWRFLLFYGTYGNMPDSPDAYRFRFFPFYFQGRTRSGEDYWALFPIGGKICNFMTLSEARFVLFPLYADGNSAGVEFRTVLWPFFMERHGEHIDQLRLWPFFGTREQRSLHATENSRFILWPFWTDQKIRGDFVNGGGFVFFPFYAHSEYDRKKRGHEESWSVIPPFFTYAHGDDGYRKLNAPWPFIRQLDIDDRHERHVWPIAGVSTNNHMRSSYFLWPLFKTSRTTVGDRVKFSTHAPLPLFYRSSEYEAGALAEDGGVVGDPVKSYTRVWPLFSHRKTEGGSFTRFPELSLWGGSEQIERNWAPLWSLYTSRTRKDGASCKDILWGFLSWGHDSKGRGFFQFLWFLNFGSGSRDDARREFEDRKEESPDDN